MGIKGLWEVVAPAVSEESLTQLSVREGLEGKDQVQGYRIGIDASIWMYQVEMVFRPRHGHAGENPELRALYYRLIRLLNMPVSLVFVFDGPDRPDMKRGHKVNMRNHWITERFQRLIEASGCFIHKAPGEAEAELALMNREGLIDAVLTEDSDALVFGAKTVIRLKNTQSNSDVVQVYRSNTLESHPDVKLNQCGLFLIAVLVGGDYHQAGIKGCGARIARSLAQYSHLASELYNATKTKSTPQLKQFLRGWVIQLCDILRTDPDNSLGARRTVLAQSIINSSIESPHAPILDVSALQSYVTPTVSLLPLQESYTFFNHPPKINVTALTRFCELHFSFAQSPTMLINKFEGDYVWKAILLRQMLSAAISPVTDTQYEISNKMASKLMLKFRVISLDVEVLKGQVRNAFLGVRGVYHDVVQSLASPQVIEYWIPDLIAELVQHPRANLRASSSQLSPRNNDSMSQSHSDRIDLTVSSPISVPADVRGSIIDLTL